MRSTPHDARPTVAIAHVYLTQRGGAERVVLTLMKAFPGAPVHTTLYVPESTYPEFADADLRVSPLNRVGALRRDHRLALPLLAPAASLPVTRAGPPCPLHCARSAPTRVRLRSAVVRPSARAHPAGCSFTPTASRVRR